jgi:hypothetical protein
MLGLMQNWPLLLQGHPSDKEVELKTASHTTQC